MIILLENEKSRLRQEIKRLKTLMSDEQRLHRSAQLWQRMERTPQFLQAAAVLLYWSMPDEVFTHDFIRRWHNKKSIIIPVVDGELLRPVLFNEGSLRKNTSLNLYEPQGDDWPTLQTVSLSIIPGIAFDRNNHRLGRGRGYYDRFLPQFGSYNIGVCFDFQQFDSIPFGETDVPMDEIMSC